MAGANDEPCPDCSRGKPRSFGAGMLAGAAAATGIWLGRKITAAAAVGKDIRSSIACSTRRRARSSRNGRST